MFLLAVWLLATMPAAEAAAAARYGDSGPDVRMLQELLQRRGYGIETVDGNFGYQTQVAVEALQADNGLAADGIVGEATWSLLRSGSQTSRGLGGSELAAQIIQTAQRYLGVPYVWGGASPRGFDCSGLLQYVFGQYGIQLPRTADLQFAVGMPVKLSQLRPGDMVFFSTYEPGPSHTGIYIGDGRFINATSSRGVAIDRLSSSYWSQRYIGAKRILRG